MMSSQPDENPTSQPSADLSMRMRVALEVSNTGTFLWDLKQNKLEWDSNLLRLFEISESESINSLEDFLVHVVPDDHPRVQNHIQQILEHGFASYELRVNTPSGGVKWLRDSARALFDENGEPHSIVGACTDITDLKIKMSEYQLAQQEADRSNAAKTEFIANMSHDMRTPLTAVLGFTDVLRSLIRDETEMSYLEIIERNSRSLLQLIDDVLDLSKIEAGRDRRNIEPTKLSQLFSDICESFSKELDSQSTSISFDVDNQLLDILEIDDRKLRRIITNLLSNAIRYTSNGSIQLIATQRTSSKNIHYLVIRVEDNGEGIPASRHTEIFEPFSDSKANKSGRRSTGLGLYICRKLAGSLGGSLDLVSSSSENGSVFELEVPLKPTEMGPNPQGQPETFVARRFSNRTALIVEDNVDNQLLIQTKLQNWGLNCRVVSNGKVALDELSRKTYDVVFMDIRMPVMDGVSVTKKLRSQGYTGLIIAMTAHAFTQERDSCLAAGCNWYFSKPIDFDNLNAILSDILK